MKDINKCKNVNKTVISYLKNQSFKNVMAILNSQTELIISVLISVSVLISAFFYKLFCI